MRFILINVPYFLFSFQDEEETRQLMNDLAESNRKMAEERKRQVYHLNSIFRRLYCYVLPTLLDAALVINIQLYPKSDTFYKT